MSLQDYIKEPRRDWSNERWLEHAHIMVHSPWISDADREYWRDKIKELHNGQGLVYNKFNGDKLWVNTLTKKKKQRN